MRLRWGADDGPDDAFENFAGWPELHALGGSDDILRLYRQGLEGMLEQYTQAKTTECPPAGRACTTRNSAPRPTGCTMARACGSSTAWDSRCLTIRTIRSGRGASRVSTWAKIPRRRTTIPRHKLIRSLINGSRGPMLRQATPLDWVGDPIDIAKFTAGHNERNFEEMLAHYAEYGDVVGDSFLNLVATTLPLDAYLTTGDAKYQKWIVDYMDAWLDRMKQNHGIIPSFVDLDGKIGGPDGQVVGERLRLGVQSRSIP